MKKYNLLFPFMVTGLMLGIETILYYIFFAIIQTLYYPELHIFDYALAIYNFDYNKIWIGFISYTFYIIYMNDSNNKIYLITKNLYIFIYLFIGLNILISTIIFAKYRLFGIESIDLTTFQKWFGTLIYFSYSIIFISIPFLIKNKLKVK